MDTHAVYEGAMRLLASDGASWTMVGDKEIAWAVDLAARTWEAAHQATTERTRTVSRMPGTPSADAFRSAGAV